MVLSPTSQCSKALSHSLTTLPVLLISLFGGKPVLTFFIGINFANFAVPESNTQYPYFVGGSNTLEILTQLSIGIVVDRVFPVKSGKRAGKQNLVCSII